MAAAPALGGEGVWTGSMWLTVKESSTGEILRSKPPKASSRDTVRPRSLSGKPARQLRTARIDAWEASDPLGAPAMPLLDMLTVGARRRIGRYIHIAPTEPESPGRTPVGQIVGGMNGIPSSRDLIYDMVSECVEATSRVAELLSAKEEEEE